jgi:hypothetical protein
MALLGGYLFDLLGSFWDEFEDRETLIAYWDAVIRSTTQIDSDYTQIDLSKNVLTVPVNFSTASLPVVIGDATEVDPREGFDAAYRLSMTEGAVITTLPVLRRGGIDGEPTFRLGRDYEFVGQTIQFYARPPRDLYIADVMKEDRDTIYRNFGYPVDVRRASSEFYRRAVGAIWFALWNGPRPVNIDVALDALFNVNFAKGSTVSAIDNGIGAGSVTMENGEVLIVPPYANITVSPGDVMRDFQSVNDLVTVHDYYNDPAFFDLVSNLIHPAQRYHTFYVTVSNQHLEVLAAQTGVETSLSEAATLIDRIHPEYTNGALLVDVNTVEAEGLVDPVDLDLILDAHPNFHFNYVNWSTIPAFSSEVANQVAATTFSYSNYLASPATFVDYTLDEEAVAVIDPDSDFALLDEFFDMSPDIDTNRGNYVNFFNQPGLQYEADNAITYQEYVDTTS